MITLLLALASPARAGTAYCTDVHTLTTEDTVTLETDAAGNIKPSKKKSAERIDGIVALVMAIGRTMITAAPSAPAISLI